MAEPTYAVSVPGSITTVNTLAFAVLARLSTWFGWKFAHAGPRPVVAHGDTRHLPAP